MGINANNNKGAIADINVTPLVDVMLVLLVIFMVTATLIKVTDDESHREVDMNLPVTRDNPNVIDIDSTDKIILRIDENLRIWIGDVLITDCSLALQSEAMDRFEPCFLEVEEKLGQNRRLMEERELYILGDTTIPYGFVVGNLHRIRRSGVDRVGMITNPEYLTTGD